MRKKTSIAVIGGILIATYGVLWGFVEASAYFGIEALKDVGMVGHVILISLSFNVTILIIFFTRRSFFNPVNSQYMYRGCYTGEKLSKTLVKQFQQMAKFNDYQTILRLGVPLGRPLWLEGLYEALVEIGKIIEDAALKLGKIEAQVQALIDDIGWTLVAIGELDEAEKYILRGIDVASNNDLDYYAAKGYRHLGGVELQKNKPAKALSWLNMAEEATKTIINIKLKTEMLAGIRYGQVEVFLRVDNLDEAQSAISEYEQMFLESGDKSRAVKAYAQRGKICEQQDNYLEAMDWYRKGLKAAEDLDRKDEIIRNHLGLARIALVDKDVDKARNHLGFAREIQSHTPLVFEVYNIDNIISELEKE
ncbi:MAG: tetratricopeptide repeat protein [Candidatus Scalindua sp.]